MARAVSGLFPIVQTNVIVHGILFSVPLAVNRHSWWQLYIK